MDLKKLTKIFASIYDLYKKSEENQIFDYIYNNYNTLLSAIDLLIQYDKQSEEKFVFFYQNYSKVDEFYESFQNTDKQYEQLFLFVLALRGITLTLIDKNAELKLLGKEEMKDYPRTTVYNVITTNTIENIKKFAAFILIFYVETYFSKKTHLGIDFEFNNRQIALMQLNFEPNPRANNSSYIFMVNPAEFDELFRKIFIKIILENEFIKRILHGSDSLDIPYVYTHLLEGNKNSIIKFTNKLIDTRFSCEYVKIIRGEEKKCSIYNALEYFGTITKEKYEKLEQTHDNMGPVEDISWNIHTLSKFQTLYGLYDVLFLKKFMYDIIGKSQQCCHIDPTIHKYLIPELTRFTYLERRDVTGMLKKAKLEVDPINNYMILRTNIRTKYVKNITLITVYNAVIDDIIIDNPKLKLKDLMSINYFRGQIGIICKKIVYHTLSSNYKIYKNKSEVFNEKIEIKDLLRHFEKYNFKYLQKLVTSIHTKVKYLIKIKIGHL